MISTRSRRHLALSTTTAAILLLAGCGSDTKQSSTSSTAVATTVPATTVPATTVVETVPQTATATGAFDRDAYCGAEVALETASSAGGDPSVDPTSFAGSLLPLAQAAQALAPAELTADFETAVGALQSVVDGGDPSALDSLDTSAIHQYDASSCPWTGENVTVENYHYVGLPERLVAGDYDFELSNQASEPHLLLIVKKQDGVTMSWDDLLASPDAESMLDTVAAGFSPPGGTGYAVTHLDAGEYLALCPLSQGSTGETEGTGPPHFTLGMRQVITVAAG